MSGGEASRNAQPAEGLDIPVVTYGGTPQALDRVREKKIPATVATNPHFLWVALLSLALTVGIANPGVFDPSGFILLAADYVPVVITAGGMTFVIYVGGIDLTVQLRATIFTVIATVDLASIGAVAAVVAILGAVSGYVTTRLYVPLFVSMLAIMAVIVMVIRAAMVYVDVDATHQQMVLGIILIAAIALTIDRSKLRGVVK